MVNQLYLVFFIVGLLLFGGIAFHSYMQVARSKQRRQQNVDPLLSEEGQGESEVLVTDESSADHALDSKVEIVPTLDETINAVPVNVEPTIAERPSNNVESISSKPDPISSKPDKEEERSLGDGLLKPTPIAVKGTTSEPKTVSSEQQEKVAPTLNAHQEISSPTNKETKSTSKAELVSAGLQFDKKSSKLITELVARVKTTAPVEQQDVLVLFRNYDFKFSRKVHIYGLNELTDMWRDVEFELPSARFVELGISIQLADREGSMTQKELHDFQQMVLAYSNEFDAPFDFSMDLDEAFEQANLLDNIGRRYDAMAVLNVVPKARSGFKMADIESCARDLMMSTDKNDIFMKTIGQKNNISVLYRLACTDGTGQFGVSSGSSTAVHDLVVYMNVPATPDPENVFQDMVKDATNLATWLDGKVVDKNGRVMSQRSYSILMQQVSDIAFSMQQDGLKPGDATAKKLF